MDFSQIMLVFMVLAPGVVFGVLGLLWLADWVPSERFISRVTGMTFSASILALAAILLALFLLLAISIGVAVTVVVPILRDHQS